MNPCLGYYGDSLKPCTCAPGLVSRYQKRISGLFLDRMDIFVEVPHIDYDKLSDNRLGESSSKVTAKSVGGHGYSTQTRCGSKWMQRREDPAEVRPSAPQDDSAQSCLSRVSPLDFVPDVVLYHVYDTRCTH